MRRHDRTQQSTLDLFSTAASGGDRSPSPTKQVTSDKGQRHILPRDLPAAVKHLTDRELDLLIVASVEEAKRRGRSLPSVQEEAAVPKRRAGRGKGRQMEAETVSLTRGQINAVRAAFKAGIKPSLIARQFGLSQSDVSKVLASDTATRPIRGQ
jgi:hypothetical protein